MGPLLDKRVLQAFFHTIDRDELVAKIARGTALPVATLTLAQLGGVFLLARNSLITVMARDYLITARAKGLGRMRIFWRHAFRNAMLSIVTRVFMGLGALTGGPSSLKTRIG